MIDVERAKCSGCGASSPLADLLVVTDRTGVAPPAYVHRPMGRTGCFGTVGPATRWAIAPAVPSTPPSTPAPPAPGRLARVLATSHRAPNRWPGQDHR